VQAVRGRHSGEPVTCSFFFPLLLFVAVLIKLDHLAGLFWQKRVRSQTTATGGQTVWVMRIFPSANSGPWLQNADSSGARGLYSRFCLRASASLRRSGGNFQLSKDARVTRIGQISKTSLVELPANCQCVKGD